MEPTLHINDAAALCVGRVILAWGELDFRIEALMRDGWALVSDRNAALGKEVDDQPPAEGRSNHRLKLLRRYFLVLAGEEKPAVSEFGKLQDRWQKAEKIRSSLAHGLTVFGLDDSGPYVSTWSFNEIKVDGIPVRKDHSRKYSLEFLNNAAIEMDSLEKEFSDLFDHFRRPFLLATLALRFERAQAEMPIDRYASSISISKSQADANDAGEPDISLSTIDGKAISF